MEPSEAILQALSKYDDAVALLFSGAEQPYSRETDRVRIGFENLQNFLVDSGVRLATPDHPPAIPQVSLDVAVRVLKELNEVVEVSERRALVAYEARTGDPSRVRELRALIGELWSLIIFDLKRPLWRQYPGLEPDSQKN